MSLQLVALHKHYFHTRAACTENTKEQESQAGKMTVYFKAVPGAVTNDGEIWSPSQSLLLCGAVQVTEQMIDV